LSIFLAPLLLCLITGCQARTNDAIAVFCWSQTPQTKEVLNGVERVLGRTLPVHDARGNYADGELLIKKLAHEHLRLLLVLGTQALRLTAPAVKKSPAVFALVADPYQTGAAYNSAHPDDHQENITGIASPPPLEEAIRRMKRLFPGKRQWGLLYDPAEGPSVELKQNFVTLAKAAGLDLTVLAAGSGPEAAQALHELKKKGVQVVFIPPDQFSQNYARDLLVLGQERQFIVLNGNPRLSHHGAVLSVTLNYEALGEQTGHLIKRLLGGEKPKNIPIMQASPPQVEVDEALLTAWAGYPPGKR